jgi:hypothetical protein
MYVNGLIDKFKMQPLVLVLLVSVSVIRGFEDGSSAYERIISLSP